MPECLSHAFAGSFFHLIILCSYVSRMMVQDFLAQRVRVYVGVNFGCAYALVSEHALYGAQVGSPSSRAVAKLWRSVCGLMVFCMPASAPSRFIIISIMVRVR